MTTQTQVNDIKAVEDKFINGLGSGVSAAEHLATLMESVSVSRDTTVIARVLSRAENKGDTAASGVIRFVTGQVFPGAKIVKPKDTKGVPTLKIKGINADTAAIARLKDAVERKLSIRHSTFRKVVKGDGTDTTPKFEARPLDKVQASAKLWAKNHDKTELAEKIKDREAELAALKAIANGQAVSH